MHEPAAREDGRSIIGAQQSHHLASAVAAGQTAGHEPQPRRVTADSFRALKDRLAKGKAAAPAAALVVQPPPQSTVHVEPATPIVAPPPAILVQPEPVPVIPVIEPVFEAPPPQIFVPEPEPEPVAAVAAEEEPVQFVPLQEEAPAEAAIDPEPEVQVPDATRFTVASSPQPAFAELEPPEPIPGYDAPEETPEPQPVTELAPEPAPELRLEPAPQPAESIFDIVVSQSQAVETQSQVVISAVDPPVFVKPPTIAAEPPKTPGPVQMSFDDKPEVAPQPPEDMAAILSAVFGQGAASWKMPDAEPSSVPTPVQQARLIAEEFAPAPAAEIKAPPQPALAVEIVEELNGFTQPEPLETPAEEDSSALLAKKDLPPSLLRKRQAEETDPFAQTQVAVPTISPAFPPIEIGEPDPQAGETARSLLDIMSASTTVSQPQERALAADTLLRLVPRVPEKTLIALAERVAIMETPPPLIVTRLIRDPRPEVAGPLLEKAPHIPDRDLIAVISENDAVKLRLIARRRIISPALVDALINANDTSVLLTLIRNPGAAPSHEAFHALCEAAKAHPALQAPLITRQDTPVPTAFDLFWFLPPELRRFVLSRFLTDSENLNRILKIARTADSTEARSEEESTEAAQFPERKRVENVISLLAEGHIDAAASEIAVLAQICEANALRIVHDHEGEPLTIALKVLGLSRAKFADGMVSLQQSSNSTLRKDRNAGELQSIFDSMSFNKARVLLTYWDWLALKSGPYTQLAA